MDLFVHFFLALISIRIRSALTKSLLIPQVTTHNQAISSVLKQQFSNGEITSLRISTTHYVPYMFQDHDGNFYNGIEYKLVERIAKRLNMSLSFQTTSKHSDICDNVLLNISDICVGGIFPKKNVLEYADMSVSYASDDLTWCVRKAEIMPMYLAHTFIMTPGSWTLVVFVCCYVCGFILYLLIQFDLKFEQRNNIDYHYTTWLVALPAAIGLTPDFRSVGWVTRSFYAFMLIMGFFLFQIILTRTYTILHMQRPWHQVSTFEEIVGNDFRLIGSQDVFNILYQSEKISNNKNEFFHICEHINECIELLLHDDKLAVGGSRQNILNSPSYSSSHIFCFNHLENIASYPIALYMRKDFYLKAKIEHDIQKVFEAGLFVKWSADSRSRGNYELPYEIPLQLPLTHIASSLILVVGCGSLISISTFIAEKYIFWKMKQEVKHKIWIYLEQFFDGRRHYFKNVPERLLQENKNYVYESPYPYLE